MSLISPYELVFLGEGEEERVILHGVDHIRNADDPADTDRWIRTVQACCQEENTADWAGDWPECYMAPETWKAVFGDEAPELTPAADVFSFGALMYRLLFGSLPVADASDWSDAYARGKVELKGSMSFGLRWLIGRMLAEDPADRPQSFDEVQALLQEVIGQRMKTHSVTVRRDGDLVTGEPVRLYAVAKDGSELYVGMAETNAAGRAAFDGYLPEGYAYEVRGSDICQACRWKLG